ncbi:MerC domain-containing protein [Erythrobacter sp. YT30]|uniref:MerC domain-containing protein n=1 Tax=Erythrobacter sp. YT30 TaxID=1735012 RepID=UPI00076CD9DB|nr:MerC domain-containing protein [Erythrobacter sp. YT30]KWV92042.1 hypothetical protein AUC45_12890 [Erythrobacter sp. YT30]
MRSTANIDRAAIGFSLICVVHCAILPLAAISLPVFGVVAEAEWVHWLFTSLAIVAAIMTFSLAHSARQPSFVLPAFTGITLLFLALFAEPLGFDETLPTISGAMLLAGAHLFRLFRNH